MKTLQVGDLKRNFSEVLNDVKNGKEIGISYGKKHELVAVLVPVKKYYKKNKRKLGLLKDKASFEIKGNFKISDDELLNL
ncbi:MAG: type II toxin-antitoxin system Phd/YefM family antitoxin [bacterium]